MELTAYSIHGGSDVMLPYPAPIARAWMDETREKSAYRCLPLNIANQHGWLMGCPTAFTACWGGGREQRDVRIVFDEVIKEQSFVCSNFGEGIVTFNFPWLFRTSSGTNLWIKGPTNYIKDGVQALEGVVEADWAPYTFTMNWKLTRPNELVRFEAGEPICMIVPIPRGYADNFVPTIKKLEDNPELRESYCKWAVERKRFTTAQQLPDMNYNEFVRQVLTSGRSPADAKDAFLEKWRDVNNMKWQKDYMLGKCPDGTKATEHQTKLQLKEFI